MFPIVLFLDSDSEEGSVPKTGNEERKTVDQVEVEGGEEDEEVDGGEEEEDDSQMDEEDGQATESGGERRLSRSGAVVDRTESRSYGSVTHKCEVSMVCVTVLDCCWFNGLGCTGLPNNGIHLFVYERVLHSCM